MYNEYILPNKSTSFVIIHDFLSKINFRGRSPWNKIKKNGHDRGILIEIGERLWKQEQL